MFNFEKLESWHRAIDFADLIYSSTSDFPREELFGLAMQMRRAAVSAASGAPAITTCACSACQAVSADSIIGTTLAAAPMR